MKDRVNYMKSEGQEFFNYVLDAFVEDRQKLMDEGTPIPLSVTEIRACCEVIRSLDGITNKQKALVSLDFCLDEESYSQIYITLGEGYMETYIGQA